MGSLTFLQIHRGATGQYHQLRLSTIDLQNKMVISPLSLIIITYCSTAIRICEYSDTDCSRTGGPFYGGFAFFRLYLIAQSLGLFLRKPPEF